MKKTAMLFAAVLTAAFLFVGAGCSSLGKAVTNSTAGTWYKYNGSATATATTASGLEKFSDMYVYYNSSTETLRVVATSSATIASLFYISYDKSVSSTVWAAGAVALYSKVTPASDPTRGKTQIGTNVNWGNIAAESIVNLLLK
ncbi:MAG: hypothetical protein K2K67_09040 [Treponemataceae bacterium]|nr:hypothetical protein [Treponemataceae bacterium]